MIVVAAVQLLGFTMTWLYLAVGRFLPSITYAIMITRGTLNIPWNSMLAAINPCWEKDWFFMSDSQSLVLFKVLWANRYPRWRDGPPPNERREHPKSFARWFFFRVVVTRDLKKSPLRAHKKRDDIMITSEKSVESRLDCHFFLRRSRQVLELWELLLFFWWGDQFVYLMYSI